MGIKSEEILYRNSIMGHSLNMKIFQFLLFVLISITVSTINCSTNKTVSNDIVSNETVNHQSSVLQRNATLKSSTDTTVTLKGCNLCPDRETPAIVKWLQAQAQGFTD